MYIVRDESKNIVAMCTRKEDTNAWLSSKLDKQQYTIEDTSEAQYYECEYLGMKDGEGEGQIL
jgi:hypothetical protein